MRRLLDFLGGRNLGVVGGVEGGNVRREIWLGQSIIVGGKNRSGAGREEATFWRRGVEGERGGDGGATEA